jgi:hypothetical protein
MASQKPHHSANDGRSPAPARRPNDGDVMSLIGNPSRGNCREGRPVTARKQTLALHRGGHCRRHRCAVPARMPGMVVLGVKAIEARLSQ